MKTDGDAVARRVNTFMFTLAATGLVIAWFLQGLPAVLGFLAGVAISFGNAWWMRRISMSIGNPGQSRGSGPASILAVFRYFLMLGILYVILNVSETGFLAALAGCFVHIVAVVLEVVYEITYGTS